MAEKKEKRRKAEFPDSTGVLRASWYDGTLAVTVFNHGYEETLLYGDVPEEVFDELLRAGSKGGYFNRNIRDHFSFLGKN